MKFKTTAIYLCAAILLGAVLLGCNQDGKPVGFCRPECQPKWEKLSSEEESEKLAAAKDEEKPDDPNHS